jgi:dipeptidyl aminopeptidase/acylaminoacyl peptidase
MRMPTRSTLAFTLLVAITPVAILAQQAPRPSGTKQLMPADLKGWKSIRQTVVSNDGKWFAYVVAPNEGDATVVIRSTSEGGKESTFPIGSAAGGGGGRGAAPDGAGGGGSALVITPDSKWAAFTVYPPQPAGRGGRGGRGGGAQPGAGTTNAGPSYNKMALVNLATGEKKEFDKVRRFAFNGDTPTWVAMQGYPDAPAAAPGGGGGAPAARVDGTDLFLYSLSAGSLVNVGNVAEFSFDDSGDWLAYTIDARDHVGNGVQLRNMKTDVVRAIDSDRALYRRLVWHDSGNALAVLRGLPDSLARDTIFSIVTFTGFELPTPTKKVFDPSTRSDFPGTMKIAADRAPRFALDMSAVFFGIREKNKPADRTLAGRGANNSVVQAGAPGEGGSRNQPRAGAESPDDLPSLVLWHHLDPRLQSQQLVQEQQDRSFSYLSEYRIAENKFVRLVDDALRTVNITGKDRYAFGIDTRDYDQPAAYTGRRYEDDYVVDIKTGERKLLAKKRVPGVQMASPDGRELLTWGENAQYWVVDLATGEKRDITKATGINFANTEDDHNNLVPPPRFPLGWSKDGSAVLLSDGFDVWKVSTKGGVAVNLTVDGKKNQIRYQRLYNFASTGPAAGGRGGRGGRGGAGGGQADGIDLTQPLYFATYGEWTKKAGVSRVDPGKPGATSLLFDDNNYNFEKARDADVFVFTKSNAVDFPNYYVATPSSMDANALTQAFKNARRITDANPQQKDFAWTSGVKLINYTSAKGDKLQGALYLPANYEPGKKYPMLVTIYEKRSNLANQYVGVNETSTPNRSIFTSRGYAVFDPDIVYRVNDPMMSAVWCVVPAVKAAIATGIVDSANVGVWGHSWGGSETGFLVTQTNIFKAAIAGAPLTNMVSMYASVYWNTGGSDAAIFESSQGRFKGNVAENYDAYVRNSSVFHADKVKTPLIILHNDKDGAVDFNQGITYYNTLAQLGKDVILLEYIGENHGLARPVNMKDYANRQKEWFDHYLKGTPAPDWMKTGIARIKLEDELKARREATTGNIVP